MRRNNLRTNIVCVLDVLYVFYHKNQNIKKFLNIQLRLNFQILSFEIKVSKKCGFTAFFDVHCVEMRCDVIRNKKRQNYIQMTFINIEINIESKIKIKTGDRLCIEVIILHDTQIT